VAVSAAKISSEGEAGQPSLWGRWLAAHPDARRVLETFCFTGDEATSQGFGDTAALIRLLLPPECAAGTCGHEPPVLPHTPVWNLLPRRNWPGPWQCTWHGTVAGPVCAECRREHAEFRETGTWEPYADPGGSAG
jgi:hypothetical protein